MKLKKILALIIALAMILSTVSFSALAEEVIEETEVVE